MDSKTSAVKIRYLSTNPGEAAVLLNPDDAAAQDPGSRAWLWVDVELAGYDKTTPEIDALVEQLQLDPLAVHNVLSEVDSPKVDDFQSHLLVVIHGLGSSADSVSTQELDCFLSETHLVTFHAEPSLSINAMWTQLMKSSELSDGGPDELLARLCDVVTRRMLAAVAAVETRVEELIAPALAAEGRFLADFTAVRTELSSIGKVVRPQREVFDELRHTQSKLLSGASRRRFSDVFDVSERTAHGLESVRSELSGVLDAYRGAEARRAADVGSVLTIYAAIMLPLSLIVGFFGMNHPKLPTTGSDTGWRWVAGAMLAITLISLGVFVQRGWLRRPRPKSLAGRGLSLAETPVKFASSLYASSKELRLRQPTTHTSSERGGHERS